MENEEVIKNEKGNTETTLVTYCNKKDEKDGKKIKKKLNKIIALLSSSSSGQKSSFFHWIIIISLLGYIIYSPTVLIKKPPPTKINLRQQKHNVNTTASDYNFQNDTLKNEIFQALKDNLSSPQKFHILCMHHLEVSKNYKLCILRDQGTIVYLINPKMIQHSNETQVYEETSVACNRSIVKERFKCIEIGWLNYRGSLCEERAFAVQLAMDEMGDINKNFC
jgi:peptide deformylase